MDDCGPADPVIFRLADPRRRLRSARLQQEIGLAEPLDLHRIVGGWQLEVELPQVDRLEYLFEVVDHNGGRTTLPDPANPLRAPGAFGEKSVLELAAYRAPTWLQATPVAARRTELEAAVLGTTMSVTLWSPTSLDAGDAAPLIVVHDGPEYDRLGSVTDYVGTAIASGALPPTRVALLDPGDRNDWYSACAGYAADVAAALPGLAPATVRVGVGVSLGALALLHLHRHHPGLFDAVLLQSGSFFTADLDEQESTFAGFAAVTAFVASVHAAGADPQPVPAVLTCGTVEENLANNRLMTATLRRLGWSARLVERRDAHNYVAWRDALDPVLAELVRTVVRARAA